MPWLRFCHEAAKQKSSSCVLRPVRPPFFSLSLSSIFVSGLTSLPPCAESEGLHPEISPSPGGTDLHCQWTQRATLSVCLPVGQCPGGEGGGGRAGGGSVLSVSSSALRPIQLLSPQPQNWFRQEETDT